MTDPESGQTSFCSPGDQKDMGSITSLTKTDKNQDFSTEGVTKGVEDDIPDNDCILSEKELNIDTTSIVDKVCDELVRDGDSYMMNNKVTDIKEKSLPECVKVLQNQPSGDHVSDISPESVPATPNLLDKDINKENMTAENTTLLYDKYGKSLPNKQDKLFETGFDNTIANCQMKEESCQYDNKASGDKKCQVGTDISKVHSEIRSSSMQTEEGADCSHNISGKNENHIFKKSVIIETIMNILNRNQKQLENNMPMDGNVTASGKSQCVDNKRTNKGYFQSFSPFLSVAPTETHSSNPEGRKIHGSSVTTEKVVFDVVQVKKQLKSGVQRVILHLEKLQQALYVFQIKADDSVASTTCESLKNQIKGMMIAVNQMYHIVYNTPLNNLSFLDTLNQMATQLRKAEEEILKTHDTTEDPETYFLHFQETLDSLKEGGVKANNTVSQEI